MFILGNSVTGVPELNLASIPYLGSPEGLRHFCPPVSLACLCETVSDVNNVLEETREGLRSAHDSVEIKFYFR